MYEMLTCSRLISRLALVAPILFSAPSRDYEGAECAIRRLLQPADVSPGTIALTSTGAAEDVDVLLVPTTVDPGRYAITVTRRAQDIYRADGIGLHIQTRYCYEYAYGEQAVLELQARAGYSLGSLVFNR